MFLHSLQSLQLLFLDRVADAALVMLAAILQGQDEPQDDRNASPAAMIGYWYSAAVSMLLRTSASPVTSPSHRLPMIAFPPMFDGAVR